MKGLDFVVVVGNADQVGEAVIVVIFVFFEEGVVVVAFHLDVVIAQVWDIVAAIGLIGLFQRHQFYFRVLGIDFLDVLFLSLFHDLGNRGLFEEGQRVGLAGVRGNDRILVQIVKLATRFRIDALGTKFRFCHGQSLLYGRESRHLPENRR